jgi:hypothetical protein
MATTAPERRRKPAAPTAGERLVADLGRDDDPYGIKVMVTEAGRIADRLDTLAALLSGERSSWLSLKLGRDKQIEVKVDNALGEARHQATTLRGLLAEIHRQRAGIPMGPDEDDDLDGI